MKLDRSKAAGSSNRADNKAGTRNRGSSLGGSRCNHRRSNRDGGVSSYRPLPLESPKARLLQLPRPL
jgi:hypothetical protein